MLSQYVGSLSLGEGWGEASQPEIRYKEVFELALNNPEMKDSIFVPTELDKLKEIAQLCPFVEGNAVYMARVILHAINPNKDYLNKCEIAKDPKRTSSERKASNSQTENNNAISELNVAYSSTYIIVPNPSKGEFKLLCKSNTPLHCEITTFTGQIVIKETMIPNNGTIEFSKTNLTKGLYNLKIIDDKVTVVLKIIIN